MTGLETLKCGIRDICRTSSNSLLCSENEVGPGLAPGGCCWAGESPECRAKECESSYRLWLVMRGSPRFVVLVNDPGADKEEGSGAWDTGRGYVSTPGDRQ